MIYQQETFDAVKSIINERLAQARKEVKRINKIRGKELTQYRERIYTIDDYWEIINENERVHFDLLRELEDKMGGDAEPQGHLQQLLIDSKDLHDLLEKHFKDTVKEAGGITSPALATLILEELITSPEKEVADGTKDRG